MFAIAAAFGAALILGAPPVPPAPTLTAPQVVEAAALSGCSFWYEDCYFCGEIGPYTCDYQCQHCPGWPAPICEPTGWTCPRGRDAAAGGLHLSLYRGDREVSRAGRHACR